MKKFLLTLFVFAALFTAQAQPVYACSCVIPGTPAEEMENADAVFSGEVLKIEDAGNYGYDVTIQVQQSWKGVEDSLIKVHTGMGGGDCGFGFKEGEEYVVYASLTDGELQVYSCSLTGILDESDTEGLGEGTAIAGGSTSTTEENIQWIYGAAAFVIVFGMVVYAMKKPKISKKRR